MKYRDHRALLVDSMATMQEFKSRAELVNYLAEDFRHYNITVNDEDVVIEPYCYDERIGWDTWIVVITGIGVTGFTDGPAP